MATTPVLLDALVKMVAWSSNGRIICNQCLGLYLEPPPNVLIKPDQEILIPKSKISKKYKALLLPLFATICQLQRKFHKDMLAPIFCGRILIHIKLHHFKVVADYIKLDKVAALKRPLLLLSASAHSIITISYYLKVSSFQFLSVSTLWLITSPANILRPRFPIQ